MMPHSVNHLFSGFCQDKFAAEGDRDLNDYLRSRAFPGRINLIQRRAPPSSRQHRLFRFVWTAHAVIRVASVELRTFVLLPREVRVVLNDQGLFSPDHLKSLLSWVLVLKFFLSR